MKLRKGEVLQAAAFLALIIVLAFWDVVFLGRTLLTSNIVGGTIPSGAYGYSGRRAASFSVLDAGASAWDYEPDVKVLHDDLAKGWLPLWNPYVGGGAPFLANMFSAVFSPVRLLVAAVEKPFFWDLYLLSRLFLAAFLTFIFARSIGIGFMGSMVAGIIFALSGHFILEVNMPDLDVQIWLPALLIVVDALLQKLSYGRFAVAVLLVALIILSGMPESALFVFLLAGLYFMVRAWPSGQVNGKRWPTFAKRAVALAGAGIVGLLITLPLVLPFLEYLQHAFNPRAPGVGEFHLDFSTAISIIMPRFFGHIHQTWTGVSSFSISPYVGTSCCLLVLAALCQRRPFPPLTILFSSFSLFYLLKAFGIVPIQWVSRLPLLNMSIFPKHAFPEFAFSLAILAGTGAEGLLKKKINYLRFALASVLLSLTVGVFAAYYWKVAVHAGALKSITRSCRVFGANLGLVWILGWVAHRFGATRLLALGLILLPTAELVAFIPRDRTDRYDAFTKVPFVEFLHTDRQIYRTFSQENFLYPDINAAYGIDDIRSLDPLQVRRYMEFLRKDVSPNVYDRFDGTEPNKDFLQSPLLDLMNVKYVLTNSNLHSPDFVTDLLREAFVLPTSRGGIGQTQFEIDGLSKDVLFQHPPSRIDYETSLRGPAHLKFALALDPKSWGLDKGDGVGFQVDAVSLSGAQTVFSDYIDPKNRVSDRKWNVRSVDLSRYRGREVYLIFQTRGGVTNNYDSAHWAQLPGGIGESLRGKLGESQIIAPSNYVAPATLSIGGRTLETWGQHPPATVRFRLRIPDGHPTLNFAIALDPAVWRPEMGDGVIFEIFAAPVQTLFSRVIDPKNEAQDRRWHPADVDLSNFRGQRVLLSLHTLPETNNAFDWAGWGDLRLETESERERFDLVYDHEVKIYRNNKVLPRAFVLSRAEFLTDKNAILARLTQPDFDSSRAVILEENVSNGPLAVSPRPVAPVTFDRYEPNYIEMHSTLTQPGWLVLTDTYYPGWKVRVDGKLGRILPADYIFRAVPLEAGSHVVEFIYRPASFLLGAVISFLTLAVVLLVGLALRLRVRHLAHFRGESLPDSSRGRHPSRE